ncbi:tetratricopeptide repeat protein [Candidatus Pelagibacter sp.]|uniref:tetratricopeptide repeat protein n=1 Tax=Candidatus Pelagibacter sp. TaxID=2024849 RepID=UPI003F85B28C
MKLYTDNVSLRKIFDIKVRYLLFLGLFFIFFSISPSFSSEKNITYMQILQKPNDLDLNLKYAQQQGKMGNYKQTISTLERLTMIYPENIEIKLYLLSVLVQVDSPEKATTIIEEMKLRTDLSPEDLESLKEIEEEILDREPSLWNIAADIGFGLNFTDNVNSVSKTRTKMDSDAIAEFNSALFDRTESGSLGITATRPIGEESSLLLNFAHTTSNQYKEADDDFQSYGFTIGFDTTLGNQSLSPYLIANKSDAQHDADSFSFMYGIGGFFSVGERNSFSYGYSYSDSKANHNSSDLTAQETNSISHNYTLGYDLIITQIISSSLSLGYTDNDSVVDAGNDAETYDVGLVLNFAFPWAFISVGNSHSFNDYKKEDTTVNSNRIRSDHSMTSDIMITKALGDFFPALDPNRTLFMNLSYEKLISEGNILNYDYIADSFAFSFTKSLSIMK